MGAEESMKEKLAPLKIYNITQNSEVQKELSIYAAALDTVESNIALLERECFINTAEDFGLDGREEIWGTVQREIPIDKRRELISAKLSIGYDDFNLEAMKKFLSAINFDAEIIEMPDKNRIYIINKTTSYTKAEQKLIKKQIENFFPAHLELYIDFRTINWDTIDSKNRTFQYMDNMALSWDKIDAYGL